ncbi:MAG: hypothetical protein EPN30_05345 [Actinomycetota bacterium]|nr:MAG: hypothetical protein EPN30_05345 [Actinomycetota bacterium]
MTNFIEPLDTSRQFQFNRRVALSDTDPSGRLRLDACARFLQDVAAFDAIDADISEIGIWVLRQNKIFVEELPTYGTEVNAKTYLTGSGRAWVERTSVISRVDSEQVLVRARALWVLTNSLTGVPISVPKSLYAIYGPLATLHKVTIRDGKRQSLPDQAFKFDWQIRFSDQDILAHLNNAIYLEALEEVLHQQQIKLTTNQRMSCQITYRESTSYEDPSDTYFLTTEGDGAPAVSIYFAKDGLVRTTIDLKILS